MTPSRILVVGGGAREHALAWRLRRDPGVAEVHVAPGNPGMADLTTVHPTTTALDVDGQVRLASAIGADLVVVGPEAPLAAGLVDRLSEAGLTPFGPTQAAAALEASKAFCREVAESVGMPMADGRSFDEPEAAIRFARALAGPVAVKADGLAAGKGVRLCQTLAEAVAAIRALGRRVVVERQLVGAEASLMAICDGTSAVALPAARDYKRVADGDRGPNTGGMGAYSPIDEIDDDMAERLLDTFHRPALTEMARRGTPFRGVLYAGLMLTTHGPYLLEFNARFGDPEAEVVLPRLEGSLATALLRAARAELDGRSLTVSPEAAVAVVLASRGYPDRPQAGEVIDGIGEAAAGGALVFHGATAMRDGRAITAGGRVLTVVGRGMDVAAARSRAYEGAAAIGFAGVHYRSDIAAPALAAVGA